MPLVKIQSTKEVTDEILQLTSDIVKSVTGKPDWAIMVTADLGSVCMNRETGGGAFIDVRGVGGLSQGINAEISKQVSRWRTLDTICFIIGKQIIGDCGSYYHRKIILSYNR